MINFKNPDGFYKTKIQIEKEVRELERKFDILCRIKEPGVTKKSSLKCLGKSSNKMGLYCHEEVRKLEADLKVAISALENIESNMSDKRELARESLTKIKGAQNERPE